MTGEPLTLDRLLRYAMGCAGIEANGAPPSMAADGRALEYCRGLLTPRARLELIADLFTGLPRGPYAVLQVDLLESEEAIELVRSLGGEFTTFVHGDGYATERIRVVMEPLDITAKRKRPATADEMAVLRALPPKPAACVIVEAVPVAPVVES